MLVLVGIFLFALSYYTIYVIKSDHDWGHLGLGLFFVGLGYVGIYKERSLRSQGKGFKTMPWDKR